MEEKKQIVKEEAKEEKEVPLEITNVSTQQEEIIHRGDKRYTHGELLVEIRNKLDEICK